MALTYKCNSTVGHCFDNFWGFSPFLAALLWFYDNKKSGEEWLDGEITDWLRMTQSVVESESAEAWRRRARQESKSERE